MMPVVLSTVRLYPVAFVVNPSSFNGILPLRSIDPVICNDPEKFVAILCHSN